MTAGWRWLRMIRGELVVRVIVCAMVFALVALVALWPRGNEGSEASLSPSPPVDAKPVLAEAQWNCFRGPKAGVSHWPNAPVAWDGPSGRGVVWKTALKMAGVSSPILWSDRVFLTEGSEAERAVLAFDAANGKLLWRQVVPDGGKGEALPSVTDSGMALPTPVCDPQGVYALFGTGDLVAFSHAGQRLWQIFLQRPVIGYGFASSLCISGGLIFVQFDVYENGRVLAIEASTGKIRWGRERLRGATWSSPLVIPGSDGKPVFLVNGKGSLTAFGLDGEVAWDLDGVTGEVTPSPAYWNGHFYAVNVGSFLICYKTAKDPVSLWRHKHSLSDTSSPVATNGLVFMAGADGKLVCLDALAGTELWSQKVQGCYASLVVSGDRVYALGRDGTMQVVAAERSYRLVSTCALGERSDATPAVGDGRIYIRGRVHLWCLGNN
jgi:outer membrane protein assembly factor BamB